MLRTAFLATSSALALLAAVPEKASADSPSGGWYVSGFGGWAKQNDFDFSFTGGVPCGAGGCDYKHSLDDGYVVGGAVGMIVTPTLRVEVEVAHSQQDVGNDYIGTTFGFIGAGETGEHTATSVLVNAWFNGDFGGVQPYIGGGVGVGFYEGDLTVTNGAGAQYSGDDTVLAGQLGLGVRIPFSSNLELDLGYRLRGFIDVGLDSVIPGFETSDESHTIQAFQAGLTYKF